MSGPACTGVGGRGCACPQHTRRRAYSRRYAQLQRDAALARRNAGEQRCQRRAGLGVCRTRLEVGVGAFGVTTVSCPACERRRQGICRDCSRPVEGQAGKALRCAAHKAVAKLAQMRASEARHHAKRLAAGRAAYQTNEERRLARNAYKAAYRKANPEKVRAYKAEYVARHRDDPTSAMKQYQARYRKRHAAYYRAQQQARDAATRAVRPVPVCRVCEKPTGWTWCPGRAGRPWMTCMTHCPTSRRAPRRAYVRALAKAAAADPLFGLPPARIRAPRLVASRGPGGERLCVTPGCDIVLTHRRKKCTKCQRQDAAAATQQIAAMRRAS